LPILLALPFALLLITLLVLLIALGIAILVRLVGRLSVLIALAFLLSASIAGKYKDRRDASDGPGPPCPGWNFEHPLVSFSCVPGTEPPIPSGNATPETWLEFGNDAARSTGRVDNRANDVPEA
jgi:hypothetical protein